jgi:hypothetical protein
MWRILGGVVLGYLAMVLWVMATFTALWLVLGQEAAFRPGTSQVTGAWLAGSLPLAFLGAVLGGWAAFRIGRERGRGAVAWLIGVVLVVGLVSAVTTMGAEPAGPPPAGLGPFEAASQAVQPLWYAWLMPFVGAAGVWLGGRRWGSPPQRPAPAV